MEIFLFIVMVGIGISIPSLTYLNARRERKKEQALLKMTEAINELCKMQLNAEIVHGDVSHDLCCTVLSKLQYGHVVPTIHEFLHPSPKDEEIIAAIYGKLKAEADGKAYKVFRKFCKGYQAYFFAYKPFMAIRIYFRIAHIVSSLIFILAILLCKLSLLKWAIVILGDEEESLARPVGLAVNQAS